MAAIDTTTNAVQHLLQIPVLHGERPFVIDASSGETLTFAGLHEDARRVASDLQRRGLRRGERLALVLNNSMALARLYLGCLYAGIVTVPVNPALADPEIELILRDSEASLLVLSSETASRAPDAFDIPTLLLADGRGCPAAPADGLDVDSPPLGKEPRGERWDLTALAEAEAVAPLAGCAPQDILTVVYTSGTTGRPAGVVHRIRDLVDNGRLFGATVGVRPHHRFYGVLAMTYLGGYYNLFLLPYVNGASVVLGDAFDARAALDFWSPAARHGVNALWLVPTIMAILLELDRGERGSRLCRESVELVLAGTAPLAPSLRHSFERRYGVRVLENYGLSETLFLTSNVAERRTLDGSAGCALDGVELHVDEQGELLARTPYLMVGYRGADRTSSVTGPAASAGPADRAGWFRTGDLGEIDAEGNVFITGRRKDLIIRGGVNVSPAAAEDVLLDHPDVVECAVVGVSHALYGEDSVAVVRLRAGAEEARIHEELLVSCRRRLGDTNRPARIVFLTQLPRSSTGKVHKARLRELLG